MTIAAAKTASRCVGMIAFDSLLRDDATFLAGQRGSSGLDNRQARHQHLLLWSRSPRPIVIMRSYGDSRAERQVSRGPARRSDLRSGEVTEFFPASQALALRCYNVLLSLLKATTGREPLRNWGRWRPAQKRRPVVPSINRRTLSSTCSQPTLHAARTHSSRFARARHPGIANISSSYCRSAERLLIDG
jgi:hypothetical protein